MLHHIGIEVAPAEIDRAVEFFALLGFEPVDPPPTLSEFTWLQHGATQVHLMPEQRPSVPRRGHLAIVTPDLDATLAALRDHGFEAERRREHWGAPRALSTAPGGHRVELMAAPPERQAS